MHLIHGDAPDLSCHTARPTKEKSLSDASGSLAMPPTGSEKVRLQSKDTASLAGF